MATARKTAAAEPTDEQPDSEIREGVIQKTERVRKTPTEKAQHVLDVEQRKVERIEGYLREARAAVAQAERNLAEATQRRDYLAQSPDLPQPTLDGDEAPEPSPEPS